MNAIALRPQKCQWTIMNGSLKGEVQVVSQPLIIIGRSNECDIVIVNDPKCSRKHVKVEWKAQGFEIQILSGSNAMRVNGEPLASAILKDRDVVTVGETELLFNVAAGDVVSPTTSPSIRRETSIRSVPQQAQPAQYYAPGPAAHPNVARPISHQPPKAKSNVKGLVIAVTVIGLFFLWLLTGNNSKKKKEIVIRTQEQIEQDTDAAKKLAETAEKTRIQNNLSNSYEINHAQENYVKGFRDFQKGQYERARESFQACLALNPEHVLCNRYLRLAQRKFDEIVQIHMVDGRKYRDQNQFRACRAAFKNVTAMVKDQSTQLYKEAKANFDACNGFVEGRF